MPVELWRRKEAKDQAKHTVEDIVKRHDTCDVKYADMACLFQCFKMGSLGALNTQLQMELSKNGVPFTVLGGKSIFEREDVVDLLAYLRLSMTGGSDSEAFERVINKRA